MLGQRMIRERGARISSKCGCMRIHARYLLECDPCVFTFEGEKNGEWGGGIVVADIPPACTGQHELEENCRDGSRLSMTFTLPSSSSSSYISTSSLNPVDPSSPSPPRLAFTPSSSENDDSMHDQPRGPSVPVYARCSAVGKHPGCPLRLCCKCCRIRLPVPRRYLSGGTCLDCLVIVNAISWIEI